MQSFRQQKQRNVKEEAYGHDEGDDLDRSDIATASEHNERSRIVEVHKRQRLQ